MYHFLDSKTKFKRNLPSNNNFILSRHLEAVGAGLYINKNEWRNHIELIGQRYQDMVDSVSELNIEDTNSSVQNVVNALDAIS